VPPRALVTRPEPEARRWADQLCAGGIEAEALPLIEIIPPVDPQPVRQAWALLGSYAAVMFVSAHAVEQFFEQKPHLPSVQWSQNAINTVAWATGPGTGRALLLAGLAPQQIEMPGADAPQFDSEALWLRVGAQVRPGQRVLIVRGADAQGMEAGRDWLGEQLRRAGVQVDRVLAYQRGVPVWSRRAACTGGCSRQRWHGLAVQQFRGHRQPVGSLAGTGLERSAGSGDASTHRSQRAAGRLWCCLRVTPDPGGRDVVDKIVRMNPASIPEPAVEPVGGEAGSALAPPVAGPTGLARGMVWAIGAVATVALAASGFIWQKVSGMQEQLARQSADAGAASVEARAMARQAMEQTRETAARQALTEARLSEVSLQRTQLEELMQSLSRSRDENLVVDIESALRLAQQQAQLTGSVDPLLAALRSADQRIRRAGQPRLTPLQRAIGRDIDRIKSATLADLPALLVKLDELVRLVDDLPVANAVGALPAGGRAAVDVRAEPQAWWQRGLAVIGQEIRGLVRVSRIEQPEAALLSPEQSFLLRENLKLKLLNAKLALLARQLESARADLVAASTALSKYFDPASRKTQTAATLLLQVQGQMRATDLPRLDDTLAALATAAAGR
jgi:uroporphyrin-3 C-methyltransferase